MSAAVVADIIAGLALAISVLTFIRAEWWNKRKASIEVRLEMYRRPAKHPLLEHHERLVLVNHGPAIASAVRLVVLDAEGQLATVVLIGPTPSRPMGQLRDIPKLHPGQQWHVELVVPEGVALPHRARVQWRDGRRNEQTTEIWLSPQDV